MVEEVRRNPDWSRDETILGLDLYVRHRPTLLDDTHPEVVQLSGLLRRLAEFRGTKGTDSFRNPNGVAMKLGNLSSHDPSGPVGRKGLAQGAKGLEAALWREFGREPTQLRAEAARISASIPDTTENSTSTATEVATRPRIFVTGTWGFNPEREGAIGFTNRSIRDRYIAGYQPGDLMLVVGQKGEFSQMRDVGRVLGLVDLEPIAIHESQRFSQEDYRAKVTRFGSDRWQYAMPIRRAWEMASPIRATHLAKVTCAGRNARVIGPNYLQLNDDEVENVLSARMRPVRVYGADDWNAEVVESEIPVLGGQAISRGPTPSFGTSIVTREDGPTSIYVMALEGCVDALFPKLAPLATGKRVVKVGISSEPDRRQAELNWGFPPGANARWVVIKTKLYPNAGEAYAAEQRFLKYLGGRGLALGNEFAYLAERELDTLLTAFVERSAGLVIA